MSGYDPNLVPLSASSNAMASRNSPGSFAAGGFGSDQNPHSAFKSDLDRYKEGNALRDYVFGEQRKEAEYQETLRKAKQGEYEQQMDKMRQSLNRPAGGRSIEDGIRQQMQPQGGAGFTDLDWYKMNMMRGQGNGMGNPYGNYREPDYRSGGANPYQPRATELNNAPQNALARMMTRGIRG